LKITDENGTHYEGYAIDVIQQVAERLELKYSFTDSSDGQFGVSLSNGSWNGIIGDILAGVSSLQTMVIIVLDIFREKINLKYYKTMNVDSTINGKKKRCK
jgi:hypothetical protein